MAVPLGSATRRCLPLYLQQGIRKVVWVRTNRLTDASLQACHFVWQGLRGPIPGGNGLASIRPSVALPRLFRPRARRTRKSHQFYVSRTTLETAGRMTMSPLAPVAGFGLHDQALPLGVPRLTTVACKAKSQFEIVGGSSIARRPPWQQSLSGQVAVQG